RVVAAAELFACGLQGADELLAVRSEALASGVRIGAPTADPGHVIVWSAVEPETAWAGGEIAVAARHFLGTDGGRRERLSSVARQAVAAADRLLQGRRGRGPGDGG